MERTEELRAIDEEIAALETSLASVQGKKAEVYSRIVGYYRSVKNWNSGKREEYRERVLFSADSAPKTHARKAAPQQELPIDEDTTSSVLLFTRESCPNCPPVRHALSAEGVSFEEVSADTSEGMLLAVRYGILSTPTVLCLGSEGEETARHHSPAQVRKFFARQAAYA